MAKIRNYTVSVGLKSGVTLTFNDNGSQRYADKVLQAYQNHKDIESVTSNGKYVIIPYHAICTMMSAAVVADYSAPADEMCGE